MNKYVVALVQVLTIIVTALVAAQSDAEVTTVELWQIGALFVGGVVTYFVPLLQNGWAATLKFVATLAAAAITAIIPIVDTANGGPGWSFSAILIVILAVLNAALTAWGVEVRLDAVKAELVAPDVSNKVPEAVDPTATAIVLSSTRAVG